jgi:hypothetical protein
MLPSIINRKRDSLSKVRLWNKLIVAAGEEKERDRGGHTDKKENKIFPICKQIQSGAVAKLYMRKGFLIFPHIWGGL